MSRGSSFSSVRSYRNGLCAVPALAAVVLTSGCGVDQTAASSRPMAPTPQHALRGYYKALVEYRDFSRACRFVSPKFHLRPHSVVGINTNRVQPIPAIPHPETQPRRGPCTQLLRHVDNKRGGSYPFSAWSIETITVSHDRQTAEAVTTDGSCGLELVDGQWRMLWVFG